MTDYDQAHDAPVPVHATIKGEALTRPKAPRELTTESFALADSTLGPTQPTRILGANPHRCRALVSCVSGVVVIGAPGVTLGQGFTVPAEAGAGAIELRTTEAVFALAGAGGGVVNVLAEHYDG